jgi:hypothetical protein
MNDISFSPIVFGSHDGLHEAVVFAAQQVLEQDLEGVRQPVHVGEPGFGECGQAVDADRIGADGQGGAGLVSIEAWHDGDRLLG